MIKVYFNIYSDVDSKVFEDTITTIAVPFDIGLTLKGRPKVLSNGRVSPHVPEINDISFSKEYLGDAPLEGCIVDFMESSNLSHLLKLVSKKITVESNMTIYIIGDSYNFPILEISKETMFILSNNAINISFEIYEA